MPPHPACSRLAEPVPGRLLSGRATHLSVRRTSPCLEGCSLDVRGRHRRHGRWLPSRARCPHQSRPRRLDLCGHRSPRSLGMRGLLLRCLGRLLSGRARHLTVPRASPCTSCGCGRLICHAHIHSWCTKVLDFAALVQNSERTVPRWRFPRADLHKTVQRQRRL